MKHLKSEISSLRSRRSGGLSLIEMLIALAITAALLTATMVAIDASFKSYAIPAESASTQTSTRMVINRLLTMVRTSTAHGPADPADAEEADDEVTLTGNLLTSNYIIMTPPEALPGHSYRVYYDSSNQFLRISERDALNRLVRDEPIIGGVTACTFTLSRRLDDVTNHWVVDRGSIDFTVQPDDDASLDLEVGNVPPVRVVATTKPRRLD